MDAYETYTLIWRGKEIEIGYQPRSFAGAAHLQIRAKHGRPLPVTQTGYRSHFTSTGDVEHLGGPVAYVEAWRRAEHEGVQLTLL